MNTIQTSGTNRRQQLIWGLRILLSLLFLVSAVAKLYPSPYFALTTFEIKQLLPMGFSETGSAYFSRILIGCELSLGILLLQTHFFKRLVLPASFLILLVFSIHLTYEIIASGNKGNCGCFGALLPMTPLQAVIKNVIAMGILIWLFRITSKTSDKLNFPVLLSVTFASVLFIFLLGPLRYKTTTSAVKTTLISEDDIAISETDRTTPKDTTALDNTLVTKDSIPEKTAEPTKKKSGFKSYFVDIDKGKKVLCFFAPGCDHCREVAKGLTQLKKQSKDFPDTRIIFMDEEPELIPEFFAFAGATYPHLVMEVGQFWQTLGGNRDTPGVFYIWNGNIIKSYDGIEKKAFKKSAFKKLVEKPWEEVK